MRDAFAKQVQPLQLCTPRFSFFELIDSIWSGSNNQPMHRFCTLMRKMNARSFVQEDLELNNELLDEKYMASVHCGSEVELSAIRLTFFASCPDSAEWVNENDLPDDHLLGYAIIVTIKVPSKDRTPTFMLEAIVRPPSVVVLPPNDIIFIQPITNYYLHNSCVSETILGTEQSHRALKLPGSFFSQQNEMTSVCAHAALRTAINSSPCLNAAKLTNRQINDSLGITSYNATGLSADQIKRVISDLGFTFHSANFCENTSIEYDHFMYPSLESGFPTILGMETWDAKSHRLSGHVVTVLGHTINSDRWEPEARRGYGNYPIKPYIPTAEWCCHYIISDDNYGMYSTLPADAIRNFIVPTKNPNQHACMAISIVPDTVTLYGYQAEQSAIIIAHKLINSVGLGVPNTWLDRLKSACCPEKLNFVCRTSLRKGKDYWAHIAEEIPTFTQKQVKYFNALPKDIWVSEVSLPNIFTGNKHKLGDIVINANASPQEHLEGKSLALAWFPGFIQLGNNINLDTWPITSHIPLFRLDDPPLLEW